MSVINQMLRELDARDAASGDVRVSRSATNAGVRSSAKLLAAGAGLLLASAAIYWTLFVMPDKHDFPVAAAPAAQAKAVMPERERDDVATAVRQVTPVAVVAKPVPAVDALSHPAVATKRTPPLAAAARIPQVPSLDASPLRDPTAVVKHMSGQPPEAEAQQYFDEAQGLRHGARLDAAAAKYRQALERNPGMVQARIELARLMQERGQMDAALSLLKAGHAQRPDDALAITAGRMLAGAGLRDEALAWLSRGQEGLRPSDHALMGALLSQAQRHEEAIRAYRRALATDPGQGGWLLGLGLSLEALGRSEEARTAFRSALEWGQFKPEVILFLRERSGSSTP